MKRLVQFGTTLMLATIMLTSCSKETTVKSTTPKTSIPAQFTGNWSSNSVGLITYWSQGSYNGSYGNTVNTVSINSDGKANYYGYYEGAYYTTFFYHYVCTAEYRLEADNKVTINLYPYSGEQIIGTTKKSIASNSLYPNKLIVLKNCSIVNSNGKKYIRYYMGDQTGTISETPSLLEQHD